MGTLPLHGGLGGDRRGAALIAGWGNGSGVGAARGGGAAHYNSQQALRAAAVPRPASPPAGIMGNVVRAEGSRGAILCEAGGGAGVKPAGCRNRGLGSYTGGART